MIFEYSLSHRFLQTILNCKEKVGLLKIWEQLTENGFEQVFVNKFLLGWVLRRFFNAQQEYHFFISLYFICVSTWYGSNSFYGLHYSTSIGSRKNQVTLTAIVVDNLGGNPLRDQRVHLFQPALQELRAIHPDMDININIYNLHMLRRGRRY
jgi:hypothetical protein